MNDQVKTGVESNESIITPETNIEAMTIEKINTESDLSEAKPNAIQTESPYTDIDKDHTPIYNYRFSMPSVDLNSLNANLLKFNKLDIDKKDPGNMKWKEVVEDSVDLYTTGSMYQNRFTDETSQFKQGVEDPNNTLNGITNFKFKKTEGEIKGEVALLKVAKFLGLGDIINIPLPHSGLWVSVKPPTEKDLIDFYNSLFRDKIILGRSTSGLTLSNYSVFVNDKLVDFIIKHIHSVNYVDIAKEDLKNYLVIHDLPVLVWGFACTMFPNGFDYQRACVNDLEKCNYVAKAVINLSKLLWVDNSSLTSIQKQILAEFRPNKLSIDNYHKFKSEHTKVTTNYFVTKNNIKFGLKVPTMNEYTNDGLNWINKINAAIENVIIDDSSKEEEAKQDLLNQYVKASSLRQYNHFIDYIEVDDNVINDRETINGLLEMFSSNDDIRPDFISKVNKYISDTTIAVIGIPEFECPNCHQPQNKEPVNEKMVNVIPLDAINLFFQLITLRIARILEREI